MSDHGITPADKEKIIRLIKALAPEAKIYLYGSRARGKFRPGSDVDLAVDAGHPLGMLATYEIKEVLSGANFHFMFDVIDLQDISEPFKNIISGDMVLWSN